MTFKPGGFNIQNEDQGEKQEVRVVKGDRDTRLDVQPYRLSKIMKSGDGDYGALKAKFGALAATDQDRRAASRKDERFAMNPIQRQHLAIEEEERRVIEEKVAVRVAELAAEATTKAREEGYHEGFESGRNEAYEQFHQQGMERLTHLDSLVADFESARDRIYKANERYLIDLIFRVSRMILLKDIHEDRELLIRLCRHLVERVGVKENVRIRLAPEDMEGAEMIRDGLLKSFGELKNLQIEPSGHVKGGGCILETDWNVIDASLDTQIQGIYRALVGSEPEVGAEAASVPGPHEASPENGGSGPSGET